MKNNLITLFFVSLLFTCSPGVVFSASDSLMVTELKVFDVDTTFRYLYLYDGQGNKVLETKYKQDIDVWARVELNEWIYEGSNCIIQRERTWKNDEWVFSYIIDYEYDNDLKISEIHHRYLNNVAIPLRKISFQYNQTQLTSRQEFDWINGIWILVLKNDFTYFADGKVETQLTDLYQSEILLNQYLSTFSYNPDGDLNIQLIKQKEKDKDWMNSELINWYYKVGSDKIISQRKKKWILDISTWENVQKTDYEYNENNALLSETDQHWESMFWVNDSRYDYVYGTDNKLQKKVLLLPKYHQWRSNISIYYLNYTGIKANLMESKYDFWGGNTGELVRSSIPYLFNNELLIQKAKRIQISYLPIDPTGIPTLESSNRLNFISVYPNPSEGIFYFNTQLYTVYSWKIFDLNGHVVESQSQMIKSGVIDLTDLSKGIYFLRVITDQGILFQKLIKE